MAEASLRPLFATQIEPQIEIIGIFQRLIVSDTIGPSGIHGPQICHAWQRVGSREWATLIQDEPCMSNVDSKTCVELQHRANARGYAMAASYMQVRRVLQRVGAVTIALAFLLLLTSANAQFAKAHTFTVLYTFSGGADGASPSGLIRDSAGNLYGITAAGGVSGLGKVFQLDQTGKEIVLHSFGGGTDGANPTSLIRDGSGNLYGTTSGGGVSGSGTIFKLDTSGNETVLDGFPGGTGGFSPGSLIRDGAGNLYGTSSGGLFNSGMVFKLSASGYASVLYSFPSGLEGSPVGALTVDSQGNLYGATAGLYGACIFQHRFGSCGTLYKLDTMGNYHLLWRFSLGCCGIVAILPQAGLIRDAAGNLYGTTAYGGAYPFVYGTVFKLSVSGVLNVLFGFAGMNGSNPDAGVILDAAGNLYGTTTKGGAFGLGTVCELASGREIVLHSFTGGADGANPNSGLIRDAAGNLYGATPSGAHPGLGPSSSWFRSRVASQF
jgi:uncharacterized repeat protein (TIGR03803 family)